MDLNKIFLKDACPTPIGGQAVMEGIMMRGQTRTAVAVRLPNGRIHMKTSPNKAPSKWMKIPVVRGVVAFVSSLVQGTKTLMYSAEVLEAAEAAADKASGGEEDEKRPEGESRFAAWIEKRFGEKAAWNLMLYFSVVLAVVLAVALFILLPTVATGWLRAFTDSEFLFNLAEGIVRIVIFVAYIAAISMMKDIRTVFQFHGAEHKTIHCFENNLELTPENTQQFYTLHPRCGTSFLLFVMVISFVLHLFLGWPDLALRIISRLLLVPVVAGLSYELLKWAGRSDNWLVKILSMPGLYLQKLTTKEPDDKQLEVAICAMKAVLVSADAPYFEGICDLEGNLIEENIIARKNEEDADREVES